MKPVLPKRSKRFGVGKEIGGAGYVHKDYEDRLGEVVSNARRHVPSDFLYTIVKYNERTGAVSFIACPDFDQSDEPIVGDLWIISSVGRVRFLPRPADPYVYHHKWLMVADDYAGFDVAGSRQRSRDWLAGVDIDTSRIG